jgi:outer membrane protease
MKNIAGFSALVIILLALVPCPQAQGQGHMFSAIQVAENGGPFPYALFLSVSTGFLFGRGEEILYKYSGQDTYLSQLLWNVKPLFYYGVALDFSRLHPLENPGFFSSLSFKSGFPGKTGSMEDRDWLTPQDELTCYSLSDNYTGGAFLLDFFLGLSVPVKKRVLLKFSWAFFWMSFQWTGRDGYIRRSASNTTPLDDSAGSSPLHGAVAIYSQNWLLTSPGLALQIPFLRYFRADLSFHISPLVFCFARDDHILRDLEILDYPRWGLFLEPRGDIVFSFQDRFELSLSLSYRYIQGSRGESYIRDTTTGSGGFYYQSTEEAGAAWSALDSALTFKVRL